MAATSTSFVALYRGESVSSAQLVAVSADPGLVADVSRRLLRVPPAHDQDPVFSNLERGRRAALRLIQRESAGVAGSQPDAPEAS
jgi:hypothetical protein